MEDELLTSGEVARLLRVHPKHLYRLLRQGLPGRRVGRGHWRFRREEVLAWIDSREGSSRADSASADSASAPVEATVEATIAPRERERARPGAAGRVVLGRVGERWVAHALGPQSQRSADALTVAEHECAGWPSGGAWSMRVHARLLSPPQALASNVLVAGCAPVLGMVLDRLDRAGPGRGHWIPGNSTTALQQLAQGLVHVAGIHLEDLDHGADHATLVRAHLGRPAHLVRLVRWRTGLVLSPALRTRALDDLLEPPVRWVLREAGAGANAVLERALRGVGASISCLQAARVAPDHVAVAHAVAVGAADVGVCIEPVALAQGLCFRPLAEEGFDLVIPDDVLALPHVAQRLQALGDPMLRRELDTLGAYDTSSMGHATAA